MKISEYRNQTNAEVDAILKTNPWAINKQYPVQDWQYEVACNNTRLGYLDWVAHMKESNNA